MKSLPELSTTIVNGPASKDAGHSQYSQTAGQAGLTTTNKDNLHFSAESADSFSEFDGSSADELQSRSWKCIAQTIMAILVLLSAGYLAYNGVRNFPQPSAAPVAQAKVIATPVLTVTTVPVKRTMIEDHLTVTGTIRAWDELKVSSEVAGLHVKAIYADEGDHVKKGQLLAELNSGLLEAQLDQAKARLSSARANLVKATQPLRQEEIQALRAAYEQAKHQVLQEKAQMSKAQVTLNSAEMLVPRYKQLAKAGAVSELEAETKQLARDNAVLELESAIEKMKSAEKAAEQAKEKMLLGVHGGRQEDITITRAVIEEMAAQVKHLNEQIRQTKILAPDDGRILQRNVHIGDTSNFATPFFVMSRLNKLELRAQINDYELAKLKEGQPVLVSTSEDGGTKAKGTVRIISPQLDESTRLATVRIDLPADSELKPGMFVRGDICLSKHEGLTVPVACLGNRGGESFVFTLTDKRAISTTVKTGAKHAGRIEILSGLSEGQQVIERGSHFLSDRDVVDVSNKPGKSL